MQRLCPQCEKRYDLDVLECPEDGEYTIEVPDDLATLLVGTTLDGRWLIEEALGEGGMGAVFRGRQENLDRPVAIKVLRAEVSGSDKIVARFMREARVLSRLNNPHVVTIFDFGRDSETGLLYLVMELLDGKPLGDWWSSRATQSIDQALMIVEQIARGLDEAHAQDIIHRDLKPDNIFVSPVAGGVHVKVLDFGIAKVHDENQAITHTGDIHGTPYYMAPEQIDGNVIVPATDFYAIGCILHEMFTENPPFVADSVMAILMHHCTKAAEPLEDHWTLDEAPTREIIALVNDLLEKEPSARPENTHALLERVMKLRDPNHAMTPVAATSRSDAPNDANLEDKLVDTLDFPDTAGAANIEEGVVPTPFQAAIEADHGEVEVIQPPLEPREEARAPKPMASPTSLHTHNGAIFGDAPTPAPPNTRLAGIVLIMAVLSAVLVMIYLSGDDGPAPPSENAVEAPSKAAASTPSRNALTDVARPNPSTPERTAQTSAEVEQTSPTTPLEEKPALLPPEEKTPTVAESNAKRTTAPAKKTPRKTPPPEKTDSADAPPEETTPQAPEKVEEKPPAEKQTEDKDKDKTEIKVKVPPLKKDLSDELERLGNGR